MTIDSKANSTRFRLVRLIVSYDNSLFVFGHPVAHGSFRLWTLRDEDAHGEKPLWHVDRWTHVCFGYKKNEGRFTFIRV